MTGYLYTYWASFKILFFVLNKFMSFEYNSVSVEEIIFIKSRCRLLRIGFMLLSPPHT